MSKLELNRRSLFAGTAAVSLASSGLISRADAAVAVTPDAVAPRGKRGIFRRLPNLNLESYQDFLRGVRQWSNFYGLAAACEERMAEILKKEGIDTAHDADLKLDHIIAFSEKDPIITLYGRAWLDGQYYKFLTLRDAFHANADLYLSEMEANDKVGPGSLELNPTMHIPEYTKHEIHTQLGGYVGDPFAGYIYLYDTLILNDGANEQDTGFLTIANASPVPKDGKVRRIHDLGTGVGQLATSLKRRFPEAEVWGTDIGGPMVRYAHVRANDNNWNVNFAQRLAEDTKFPDNHFDIITSMQMHHEVTAEATKAIFKEIARTLRPGGLYYPIDTRTSSATAKDFFGRFNGYLTYRWNHEDWWMEWESVDIKKELTAVGLKVDENGPSSGFSRNGRPNLVAYKV